MSEIRGPNEPYIAIKEVAKALDKVSSDVSKLATQVVNVPVKYTVTNAGFLLANTVGGANTIDVSTFPSWGGNMSVWVVIDAGTSEAELRKVTSVSGKTLTLSSTLVYNHAERDTVVFLSNPVANVKLWGAAGDGSTDDSTALNRAFAQYTYQPDGYVVYIPAGNYRTVSGITAYTRTAVIGDGRGQTKITCASAINDAFLVAGASLASPALNVVLRGFTVTSTSSPTNCIRVSNASQCTIEDVGASQGVNGIYAYESVKVTITKCLVESCTGTGIMFDGFTASMEGATVSNCQTLSCGRGYYFANRKGVRAVGNASLTTTSSEGFLMASSAEITLTGNTSVGAATYGYRITNCEDIILSGNVAKTNTTASVYIDGASNGEVCLTGNVFLDATNISNASSGGTPQIFTADKWDDFITSSQFVAYTGAPVYERAGSGPVWSFRDAVVDGISVWYYSPRGFLTGNYYIYIYYGTASYTVGTNYRMVVSLRLIESGDNINAVGVAVAFDLPVSTYGVDGVAITRVPGAGWVHTGARIMGIFIRREGAHANDTVNGNLWFMGIRIQRATY